MKVIQGHYNYDINRKSVLRIEIWELRFEIWQELRIENWELRIENWDAMQIGISKWMILGRWKYILSRSYRIRVIAQYLSNYRLWRMGASISLTHYSVISLNICISHILPKTRFFGPHSRCKRYGIPLWHRVGLVGFKIWRIQRNNAK